MQQLPEHYRRVPRASSWRRSVDGTGWDFLRPEQENSEHENHRQSCSTAGSGGTLDRWLEHLDGPGLSERTVSMSALESNTPNWMSRRLPSLWEPDLKGTAHFRLVPKSKAVSSSMLRAVQNSWLPSQRRAVVFNVSSTCNPPEDTFTKSLHNPDITTLISENPPANKELGHTDGEKEGQRPQITEPISSRMWRCPGHRPFSADQEPLGHMDFPVDKNAQLKNRDTSQSDSSGRAWHAERRRSLPLHRTISIPAPPAEDSASFLKLRSGFSSITIASGKVPPDSFTSSAPKDNPSQPVVRRRQVNVVKMTEGKTVASGYRHSFAEGENKENLSRLWQTDSAPGFEKPKVLQDTVCTTIYQKNEDPGIQKRHCSTLFLHLESPARLLRPKWNQGMDRPQRPLSFCGSFSSLDPVLGKVEEPMSQRESLALPGKVNNDDAGDMASRLKASRTGLLRSNSVRVTEELHAYPLTCKPDIQERPRGFFQKAPSTGKQDHNSFKRQDHLRNADALLALKAASVLAHIKRLSQMNKAQRGVSAAESRQPPISANRPVKDSGLAPGPVGSDSLTASRQLGSNSVSQSSGSETLTLQEALKRFRPDFISRSQSRVQELEKRARYRKAHQGLGATPSPLLRSFRKACSRAATLTDAQGRANAGQEVPVKSIWKHGNQGDAKKKKEEEKKKVVLQTNRLKAEVFKKKLLDQLLQRKRN